MDNVCYASGLTNDEFDKITDTCIEERINRAYDQGTTSDVPEVCAKNQMDSNIDAGRVEIIIDDNSEPTRKKLKESF